jgi:protein gp37
MTIRDFLRSTALLAAGAVPLAALAHDYPTAERVVFVQTCMRDNPGTHYEMLNKCSCVIDTIARDIPYDDFVTMNTAANANSIGGERGSYIRDVEDLQKQIRKFRALQTQAKKSCMINLEPPVK